ncbi:MAG: 5-(carboxyamino)imidazole ribonucleotide mutase [Eubacteriales bacterium]|nr:5-(carboxyamino)imidazole ribonucleotide mutase [Eubacteriales bacterium]
MKKVLVIMGSDSDLPVMEPGIRSLSDFHVPFDVRICSAHRTPALASALAAQADEEGYGVIIAAAGLAAHLPGVIAAHTTLPVIGVPIASGPLAGQDALYAIVQMPTGIPVATVAINGSANAALLAVQILAGSEPELKTRLRDHKLSMEAAVSARQKRLDERLAELLPGDRS